MSSRHVVWLAGLSLAVACGGGPQPGQPTPAPRSTHLEFDSPRLETTQRSIVVDRVEVDLAQSRATWSFFTTCRSNEPCTGRLQLTAVVPAQPHSRRVVLQEQVDIPAGATVTLQRFQGAGGRVESLDRVEIVFSPERPAVPGQPKVIPTPRV